MSQRRRYHDGRSPAVWTSIPIAVAGFLLANVAERTGLDRVLVYGSGGALLSGLILTEAIAMMGFGNRQ